MGSFLDKPKTELESEAGGYGPTLADAGAAGAGKDFLRYGVSEMQGWRVDMEDSHFSVINWDGDHHLFGVFDGHGG